MNNIAQVKAQKLPLTKIIAHRGASAYAPENTLIAMRKAHAMGAKWVEFDVMLTSDGEMILMHDDTLTRTTSGHKLHVAQTLYSDILTFDAGSWFAEEYINERVPTLVQLFELLKELSLHINLEIKPTLGKEVETAEKALTLLEAHWPIAESPPIISSGSELCLQTVHKLAPHYCLGAVIHSWYNGWQECLKNNACQAVSINHRILNAKKTAELKKQVKYILAYTVNDPWRAEQLLQWGVDAVFTDKPDLLTMSVG